jgi:hypothetical protein
MNILQLIGYMSDKGFISLTGGFPRRFSQIEEGGSAAGKVTFGIDNADAYARQPCLAPFRFQSVSVA